MENRKQNLQEIWDVASDEMLALVARAEKEARQEQFDAIDSHHLLIAGLSGVSECRYHLSLLLLRTPAEILVRVRELSEGYRLSPFSYTENDAVASSAEESLRFTDYAENALHGGFQDGFWPISRTYYESRALLYGFLTAEASDPALRILVKLGIDPKFATEELIGPNYPIHDRAVLALHDAAIANDVDLIRRILSVHIAVDSQSWLRICPDKIDSRKPTRWTALMYAVDAGATDAVKELLAHGADGEWVCKEIEAGELTAGNKETEMLLGKHENLEFAIRNQAGFTILNYNRTKLIANCPSTYWLLDEKGYATNPSPLYGSLGYYEQTIVDITVNQQSEDVAVARIAFTVGKSVIHMHLRASNEMAEPLPATEFQILEFVAPRDGIAPVRRTETVNRRVRLYWDRIEATFTVEHQKAAMQVKQRNENGVRHTVSLLLPPINAHKHFDCTVTIRFQTL